MAELKTYGDQIVDFIKKALLNGDLVPGQKINEVHLAARLNISRAPVREALQLMVRDGLVVSIPQRGKFVRELSSREIMESYEMGGVLEGVDVAKSAHLLTGEDFAALEDIVAHMNELRDCPHCAKEFSDLDRAFHETLISHAQSRACHELGRKVCQRISQFLLSRHWSHVFSAAEFAARHRDLLAAIKSQDAWRIETAVRAHYLELGQKMARYGKPE